MVQKQIVLETSRYHDMDALVMQVGKFGEDHTDLFYRGLKALAGRNGGGHAPAARTSTAPDVGGLKRAERGTVTDAAEYIPFILKVLMNKPDHAAPSKDVIREVLSQMDRQGVLSEVDKGILPRTKVPRASNKVQWGRNEAVKTGLLKPKRQSGHGVWALTPKGLRQAQRLPQ